MLGTRRTGAGRVDRRVVITAGLVTLLILAGCGAGGGGTAPGTTAESPTPTATQTEGDPATDPGTPTGVTTPTAPRTTRTGTPARTLTATPTPTTPATRKPYPPGYTADGVDNHARAIEAHVEGLTARESFAIAYNGTLLNRSNRKNLLRWNQAVETDTKQIYGDLMAGDSVVSRYFANGTVYVREDPPGENNTRYGSREVNYEMRRFTATGTLFATLGNISFGEAERTTRGNTTAYRYHGRAVNNPSTVFGGDLYPADVRDFDATLVIDEQGVVRELTYSASVRAERGRTRLLVSVGAVGLNGTEVREPDWKERAE